MKSRYVVALLGALALAAAPSAAQQPAEGKFRITRACLEALCAARNPYGLITRGPLVLRDLDVLQESSRRAKVGVSVSIPTLDERVWKTTEPGTSPPAARMRAVKALVSAGVRATVAMAPILPGLSDRPELLADVVRGAREAGACGIWVGVVNLREGTREHFFEVLAREWPEELPRYEAMFGARAYPAKAVTRPIEERVAALKHEHGVADRRALRWTPPEDAVQMEIPGWR